MSEHVAEISIHKNCGGIVKYDYLETRKTISSIAHCKKCGKYYLRDDEIE